METLIIAVLIILLLPAIIKGLAYSFGRLCGNQGLAGDIANIVLWAIRHIWVLVVVYIILMLTQ